MSDNSGILIEVIKSQQEVIAGYENIRKSVDVLVQNQNQIITNTNGVIVALVARLQVIEDKLGIVAPEAPQAPGSPTPPPAPTPNRATRRASAKKR